MDESFPFIPEVHLFHSKAKAERFIRKAYDKVPKFYDTGAQTWCENGIAVVLMTTSDDMDWHTDAALLCHEAYHVVSMHYDHLGEEHPSEEFMAYGLQVVSKALFEAHEKWKMRKSDEQMQCDIADMKGNPISVGCKVSDGLGGGTVISVDRKAVTFKMEGMIGGDAPHCNAFNKPENLLVIDDDTWGRCVEYGKRRKSVS